MGNNQYKCEYTHMNSLIFSRYLELKEIQNDRILSFINSKLTNLNKYGFDFEVISQLKRKS